MASAKRLVRALMLGNDEAARSEEFLTQHQVTHVIHVGRGSFPVSRGSVQLQSLRIDLEVRRHDIGACGHLRVDLVLGQEG